MAKEEAVKARRRRIGGGIVMEGETDASESMIKLAFTDFYVMIVIMIMSKKEMSFVR